MRGASAIWLVPGLNHPLLPRFAEFLRTFFDRFEAFDYRAAYLESGRRALSARLEKLSADVLIYSQFSNTYSYIGPEWLAAARARSIVVGFGFDDEIWFDQAKYFYQACNAVITTDPAAAAWLGQIGVHSHLAAVHMPDMASGQTVDEDIPVSFVGDVSKPGRREYITYLESNGLRVMDFGAGTRNGTISTAEVVRVFQRSKINLNFTRTNPPEWLRRHDPIRADFRQIKSRPFELAAMGRFCLSEWAHSIPLWLRPGQEIDVFSDPAELLAKVRRYLGDESLRLRMARAARERYETELNPKLQFGRIFDDILAAGRGVTRPVMPQGNGLFYESMGRSRGVAALHALQRKAFLRALREPLGPGSTRLAYWRGVVAGVADTVRARWENI